MILRKLTPAVSALLLLIATTAPVLASEGSEAVNLPNWVGAGLALTAVVLPLVVRRVLIDRR